MGQFFSENKAKLIGAGILAVLLPLLAASEKSMKSLIDDWFESCSVVVEVDSLKTEGDNSYIPINLYVQGNPPNEAKLVASANKEIFTKLEYIHDLNSGNRALHPKLPLEVSDKPLLNIVVKLTPFKSKYLYSFRAHVSKDKALQIKDKTILIGAFVQFPEDVKADLCRVEASTFFTILVGQGSLARFAFLVFLVVTITGAITALRK